MTPSLQSQQPSFSFVSINLMLLGTLYKWNHSFCPFVSGLFHSAYHVLEVHPCSSMCQSFPSFLSLNNTPLHLYTHTHTHTAFCLYPFIPWWTLKLLPSFGYCELCCCESEYTKTCLYLVFFT